MVQLLKHPRLRNAGKALFPIVALLVLPTLITAAVPEADHVRLKCIASRMNVNDYSIRKQVRVDVTLSSSDEARFEHLEEARLTVVNPAGVSARVQPWRIKLGERKFKAAHADIVFKLVEDSASRVGSNVPRGFFRGDGPYRVRVDLRWESYRGTVSFAEPIALRLTQDGNKPGRYLIDPLRELRIDTRPESFGPVYYKRRDVTNFMYQLANMDSALESKDYHPQVESPQYFFQIRSGWIGEETTELLDPAEYIADAQRHMIRSDGAACPMVLPAGTFQPGQTVLIEFSRLDTEDPSSVFHSTNERCSDHVVAQERVVYVLEARPPGEAASLDAAGAAAAAGLGEE